MTTQDFKKSVVWFPVIGLLIGLLSSICFNAFNSTFGGLIAAVSTYGFTLLLTGALHEDGFADTCDGLGGGRGRSTEKKIAIMRDSQTGVFGVLGLISIALLEISCLLSTDVSKVFAFLLISHLLSRWSFVLWLSHYSPVGSGSKASELFFEGTNFKVLVISSLICFASGYLIIGPTITSALLVCLLTSWLWGAYCYSIFGGMVGDLLGAGSKIVFISVYLTLLTTQT